MKEKKKRYFDRVGGLYILAKHQNRAMGKRLLSKIFFEINSNYEANRKTNCTSRYFDDQLN
jgi:predicted acetyltransferase